MTTETRSYHHPKPVSRNITTVRAKGFTARDGVVYAVVELGDGGSLWLASPAPARELLATAWQACRILEPDTDPDDLLALIAPAACPCNDLDCPDAAPDVAQPAGLPEGTCPDCGETSVPLNDNGKCWNRASCAARTQACAKCHAESREDGSPFGARCLDMCHEALEFDHVCAVCATPEEAKALGFPVIPAGQIEAEAAADVRRITQTDRIKPAGGVL